MNEKPPKCVASILEREEEEEEGEEEEEEEEEGEIEKEGEENHLSCVTCVMRTPSSFPA